MYLLTSTKNLKRSGLTAFSICTKLRLMMHFQGGQTVLQPIRTLKVLEGITNKRTDMFTAHWKKLASCLLLIWQEVKQTHAVDEFPDST